MARKRKIQLNGQNKSLEKIQEDDNEETSSFASSSLRTPAPHGPMYTIMSNVQLNETYHKKYVKEMQHLYKQMDHDAFMFTFIKMIKNVMQADESNEYAITTLLFCSKYIASYDGEGDITHPVLSDIFNWLLKTTSNNPHIRFRICQFVNYILNALGQEAALDDTICDNIMKYMVNRLRDISSNVRVQAIYALQRLQNPDNPDDLIVQSYKFHLSSDPSSRVRQAVITSIGRNYNTIPYILERLWDSDDKTRRHTYVNMTSYPVKAYKVSERITFLEQGLNDRSESVRKVVTNVMLPQWLQAYNKNYIAFVAGLKIDANETEMEKFRKITKITLQEIFKHEQIEDLIECLPLQKEAENEFTKCILDDELNIETSFYWLCLIEYLIQKNSDEIDEIIPELTTFCNFVLRYCESQKFGEEDKWRKMEFQFILLTLLEILYTFDLGDEIGRNNLKQLIGKLLINHELENKCVEMIVKCVENLIENQEDRLNFFIDIIREITDAHMFKNNDIFINRELLDECLEKNPDKTLKLKLSALKVKILDLEEQETDFVKKKNYVLAQKISEEKQIAKEQYTILVQSILNQSGLSADQTETSSLAIFNRPKKVTTEEIIKCLQISFYMVNSRKVRSLTPNVCDLYKEFIRRHIESNQIAIRDWALKCGTAYSMLYEQLAKDVYNELYSQFFKNQNVSIWKTAIYCLFELIDRYGFATFESEEKPNKSKRSGRMLYNTMEFLDAEEDDSSNFVDVVFMVSHILDTCNQESITEACIIGLSRLILHGHTVNDTIVPKLLLKYFNPLTEPAINQILGVFFENLVHKKKQEYLQACLLSTVTNILVAPYDSPLHEIKPDTILKFVIDSTRPQFCLVGSNIHNEIALSFLNEIQNNISNKELAKLLSKELISLEINFDNSSFISDLKNSCTKLLQGDLDTIVAKKIINFKAVLDGTYRPSTFHPQTIEHGSDEENIELSEDEETQTRDKTKNSEPENANNENVENTPTLNVESITENLASKTSNETQEKETETEKTPTMFGRENSPNIRYLRKSLNSRQQSIPTPHKRIRIEAKMQADKKGIEEVSDHENEDEDETIENLIPSENSNSRISSNITEIEGINMNEVDEHRLKSLQKSKNTVLSEIIDNTETLAPIKSSKRKSKNLTHNRTQKCNESVLPRSLRKKRNLSTSISEENTKSHNDNNINKSLLKNSNKKITVKLIIEKPVKTPSRQKKNSISNSITKSTRKAKSSSEDSGNESPVNRVRNTRSLKKTISPSRKEASSVILFPSSSIQTQKRNSRNRSSIVFELNEEVEIIPSSPIITRTNRKRAQKIAPEIASSERSRNKRVLGKSISPTSENNLITHKIRKKKKSNNYSEIEDGNNISKNRNSSSPKTRNQIQKSKYFEEIQTSKSKNSSESSKSKQIIGLHILNENCKTRSASKGEYLFNNIITRKRLISENVSTPKIKSNSEKNENGLRKNSLININPIVSLERITRIQKFSKIPVKKTNESKNLNNAKNSVKKNRNEIEKLQFKEPLDEKTAKENILHLKRVKQSKLPLKVNIKKINK